MKDGARAQGDFAKTADGAANTAKRNAAAFEDLQAKVGQGLLSAFQALQGAMGGLISMMLGGDLLVGVVAFVVSAFIMGLNAWLANYRLPPFYQNVVGGFWPSSRPLPPPSQFWALSSIPPWCGTRWMC